MTDEKKPTRARRSSTPRVPKGFVPVKPIGDMGYRKRRDRFAQGIASSIPFLQAQMAAVHREIEARRNAVREMMKSNIQITEENGKAVEVAA